MDENNQPQEEQMSWSFAQIWNDSLAVREEAREFVARDYCYASEIGGSMIDRYLKMTGVTPTNPPNARSFRKFDAGDMWEGICRFILNRAGLIIARQEHLSHEYPELLRVSGRLDFFAGGQPDWGQARKAADEIELIFGKALDEQLGNRWKLRATYMIDQMQQKYGTTPLREIVLEIKSCSSFMYDRYEATRKPSVNHALQAFHYLKAKNMREAHVVYVCRDDCRLLEYGIFNPSMIEDIYKADIEKITYYYKNKIQPELEPQILFDEDFGKFQKNWKVEYSNYLTMLYGYKEPIEYRDAVDSKVSSMNRTLTRIIEEKKMTPLNLEVITMAKGIFPDFDKLVDFAKTLKAKGKLVEDPTELAIEKAEVAV